MYLQRKKMVQWRLSWGGLIFFPCRILHILWEQVVNPENFCTQVLSDENRTVQGLSRKIKKYIYTYRKNAIVNILKIGVPFWLEFIFCQLREFSFSSMSAFSRSYYLAHPIYIYGILAPILLWHRFIHRGYTKQLEVLQM